MDEKTNTKHNTTPEFEKYVDPVHFLDYSINGLAESWARRASSNEETPGNEETPKNEEASGPKKAFSINRSNLKLAIADSCFFKTLFSHFSQRENKQIFPIPLETEPFFYDFIAALAKQPKWKSISTENFPDNLVQDYLESAYNSIASSPERLSYYEKVLFHTDKYSSFVVSRLWEEQLDYRYALLKELLTHYSGPEKIDGLINLLRTMDNCIATYSPLPPSKENTDANFIDKLPELFFQLLREEMYLPNESASDFLLRQEVTPPSTYTGKKAYLTYVNKRIRGKNYVANEGEENRTELIENARNAYLSSLKDRVDTSAFQEKYYDLKKYLQLNDWDDSQLAIAARGMASQYYGYIWTHAAFNQNKTNLATSDNFSEVVLTTMAQNNARNFANSFRKNLFYFKCIKEYFSSPAYEVRGAGLYSPVSPSTVEAFVQCMGTYLGSDFENSFQRTLEQNHIAHHEVTLSLLTKYLFFLFDKAKKELNISPISLITHSSLQFDIEYFIEHADDSRLSLPCFDSTVIDYSTPSLYYILFTFKIYHSYLEGAEEIFYEYKNYESMTKDFLEKFNASSK